MKNKGQRILIIDDEAVFREAIMDALSSCGYSCDSEEDPADGIMRLKKGDYDLVLLDIMMDPVDGWDTLAHIRSLPGGTDIPVIMTSAKKLQVDEIIRYSEYVAGFLTKPFIDADFCNEVDSFFAWHHSLIAQAQQAQIQGVPAEICSLWVFICRQIRAIELMKEVISPRCIPEDFSSEEECLEYKMNQLYQLRSKKIEEKDDICIKYPSLSSSSF